MPVCECDCAAADTSAPPAHYSCDHFAPLPSTSLPVHIFFDDNAPMAAIPGASAWSLAAERDPHNGIIDVHVVPTDCPDIPSSSSRIEMADSDSRSACVVPSLSPPWPSFVRAHIVKVDAVASVINSEYFLEHLRRLTGWPE